MKKPDLIEELLRAVRIKANRLTVKQLNELRHNHSWISKRKRSKK